MWQRRILRPKRGNTIPDSSSASTSANKYTTRSMATVYRNTGPLSNPSDCLPSDVGIAIPICPSNFMENHGQIFWCVPHPGMSLPKPQYQKHVHFTGGPGSACSARLSMMRSKTWACGDTVASLAHTAPCIPSNLTSSRMWENITHMEGSLTQLMTLRI